jgi:sulfur relay (sulfurtransferase) complex TusBCD TusD component (DsrE family)
MIITIIVNDAPYGNERPYNALRYATALLTDNEIKVNVFLMADSVV